MRSCLIALALACFVAVPSSSCSHAPPTLSPAGVQAFNQFQVQKDLDLLRDTAITANAQQPPLLSTDATRKVVEYHKAAITTIHAAASGWKTTLLTGLNETAATLAPGEQAILAPYVTLLRAVLAGVPE
jgi:hypothetical protein